MTCSGLTHYIPYDLRSGFDVGLHCLDHSGQKRVAGEINQRIHGSGGQEGATFPDISSDLSGCKGFSEDFAGIWLARPLRQYRYSAPKRFGIALAGAGCPNGGRGKRFKTEKGCRQAEQRGRE
jgi:hypothetical protein